MQNVEWTKIQFDLPRASIALSSDNAASQVSSQVSSEQDVDVDKIMLLSYSRTPSEFREALLRGPELRSVRDDLAKSGLSCTLEPSGAKIFVWPKQYDWVLESLVDLNISLFPSHVIIAESLLSALDASIATLPSRLNVRPKKNRKIDLTEVPR